METPQLKDPLEGYALSEDCYGERAIAVRCFPTPNGNRTKLGDVPAEEIEQVYELFASAPCFPEDMSYVVHRRVAIAHPSERESHVRTLVVLHPPEGERPPPIYAWRDYGSPVAQLKVFHRTAEGEITHGEAFLEVIGETHVTH